jgi:glycosyltransferase involved in cell wall biosynthesis
LPRSGSVSRLSILYISYPLLPLSDESAGGAEQMLLTLEREMHARGHRTIVAASSGSRVSGRLLVTGSPAREQDSYEKRDREHAGTILSYLKQYPGEFDLIHDESGSFFRHAGKCPVPLLATLHLPRSFYREEWFLNVPPNLAFNCVSQTQARSFANLPNLLGVVHNGVAIDRFPFSASKGNYLLWIGRICEEKAPHVAIAVAKQTGMRLVLAGQVYPFTYHRQYFEREIQPRLGKDGVEFVDSPSFMIKAELLRKARALLLTSTAEETSSLVAMEAMACGTPVVAMRRGALPEIVADSETGFVIDTAEEMAAAVAHAGEISSATCRRRIEQHFSAGRMAQQYEALYQSLLLREKDSLAA